MSELRSLRPSLLPFAVPLLLLGVAARAPCQSTGTGEAAPTPIPSHESDLRRFRALEPAVQRALLRRVERLVELDPDPLVQSILNIAPPARRVPVHPGAPVHDPAKWAKVAPKRKRIPASDARHRELRKRAPVQEIVPSLHKHVFYDWHRGDLARRAEPLRPEERFENLLNGFVPGSDAAMAEVLRLCDQVPDMRPLAQWFAHLYADLDARVYDGITLYERWFQEETVDVPDVDAIPFATLVLSDRSFRSPIPAGPKRTQLYAKIQDAALRYRKFRTLREAAAAAFICDAPRISKGYQSLVPRFHLVYAFLQNDPERVARLLEDVRDRTHLLKLLDDLIVEGSEESKRRAFELREGRRRKLRELAAKIRKRALAALEEAERQSGGRR